MTPDARPTLLYDSDCAFCTRWATRCERISRGAVSTTPAKQAAAEFPQVPRRLLEAAVALVATDGTVSFGAEAIFRALAARPGGLWRWPLKVYLRFPLFRRGAEGFYGLIAARRHHH